VTWRASISLVDEVAIILDLFFRQIALQSRLFFLRSYNRSFDSRGSSGERRFLLACNSAV